MLTSKQRAKLKGYANKIESILQLGKGGISDALMKQVDDALTAREMIKLHVLDTAPDGARALAETLAQRTGSEVVQVIGSRIVLFRRNKKHPIYEL